jgi:hypothetical protein
VQINSLDVTQDENVCAALGFVGGVEVATEDSARVIASSASVRVVRTIAIARAP